METKSGRRAPASILNLALTDQDSLALIFQLRERTFRKGDLRSMASDQADSPQRGGPCTCSHWTSPSASSRQSTTSKLSYLEKCATLLAWCSNGCKRAQILATSQFSTTSRTAYHQQSKGNVNTLFVDMLLNRKRFIAAIVDPHSRFEMLRVSLKMWVSAHCKDLAETKIPYGQGTPAPRR